MRQSPVPQFQVLTPDEARELEAIAARIIPTDDAPGAREAGVIHFLDRALATFAQDQVPVVRAGLADLGSRVTERRSDARFSDLPPEEQDELLRVIEQSRFFGSVRFATIVGTFANPSWGGNRDQVGWALLGHEMRPAFEPPFGAYDAEANRVGNR
jgi:gluconate 2-dehydrogenase gamma chain